ncbi:MAG: TIM barrel protein [Candidatus Latescibacterota bacterium]
MKLSVFTDEISPDAARAVDLAARWGIRHLEARGLAGGRFPEVSDADLDTFHQTVVDAGLTISGVSPGIAKIPVDHPAVVSLLTTTLPRACLWAQDWGTDLVSCFAFQRQGSGRAPSQVVETLARMAEIAHTNDCRLVLENEAGCWAGTGLEAAEIAARVGPVPVRLAWDPANAARAGSLHPFPDEYEQIRDLVEHVHLKNYDARSGEWSLLERGVVDWSGQLAALERDGYAGYGVIETHLATLPRWLEDGDPEMTPLEVNTRRNLEFLRGRGIAVRPSV